VTYLPPVVIEVTGSDRDFLATLARDRAALAAFADQATEPKISADDAPLTAKAAEAEAVLRELDDQKASPTVTLNDAGFKSAVAADIAALKALSDEVKPVVDKPMPWWASAVAGSIAFDPNVGRWRQISGPQGGQFATDAQLAAALAGMKGNASSLPPDALAALMGAVASSGGAGGDGGAGVNLLKAFGFGSSNVPGLGFAAGFGTLGSLMGFGAEHIILTGVGIGGSMIGAGIGAGLLGLGAGGTMAVGMGTDMAGLGQAANDIKAVYKAQQQLNQAIAEYGAASTQAAAAQGNLNYVLSSFSPVAQQAVLQAANTANAFVAMFDAATGQAEKIGAEIINQAMLVGEKFLPTIGKYAAQNMGIIQRDIQPLFSWLQSEHGGLGIFTNLEQLFQKGLPTAIHAGTQAFEWFMQVVDDAAQYTGGFLQKIDKLFTVLNSPRGLSETKRVVKDLIGNFEVWLGLVVQVGRTIYDIFQPAVHLGEAVASTLTSVFKQIDTWLTSTPTHNILHNLFSVHFQEVITGIGGAIKAVLPLVEGFANAFMQVLTVGAQVVVGALQPITALIKDLARIPFATTILGWALALKIAYDAFMSFITPLATKLGLVGSEQATLVAETKAQTDAMAASWDRYAAAVSESTGIAKKDIDALKAQTMMTMAMGGGGGTTPLVVSGGGERIQPSELGTYGKLLPSMNPAELSSYGLTTVEEGAASATFLGSLKGLLSSTSSKLGTMFAFNKAGLGEAGMGLLGVNLATNFVNELDAKWRTGHGAVSKGIQVGTDVASGAATGAIFGTQLFPGVGTLTGAGIGAALGGAMPFQKNIGNYLGSLPASFDTLGHQIANLFGFGPSKQQQQHTTYLAQIATNIASIQALGAKDVSVQGVKAAVAANTLAHTKGVSNQTLHVVDDATKRIASLGAKDAGLKQLEQQVQAMKEQYGANSPQERQAMQLLENTAKTWFPQLSKDKTVGQMSKSITDQEKLLFDKSSAAQEDMAVMKTYLASLTNGQGVKGLQEQVSKDKSILSVLEAQHATKGEIAAEKSILSQAEASLKQAQAAQKNIAQDKTIISTAAKQYNELQAIRSGLVGELKTVNNTLNAVHKLTGTATLKVS
jgi:hypothetical protein